MDSVRIVRLAAFLYLSLSENGLTEYYISTGGEAQGRQPTATHKSDISSLSLFLGLFGLFPLAWLRAWMERGGGPPPFAPAVEAPIPFHSS